MQLPCYYCTYYYYFVVSVTTNHNSIMYHCSLYVSIHHALQLTWFQYPKYRLWRKNLQAFSGEDCAGVDLNRNFDVTNWNQVSLNTLVAVVQCRDSITIAGVEMLMNALGGTKSKYNPWMA